MILILINLYLRYTYYCFSGTQPINLYCYKIFELTINPRNGCTYNRYVYTCTYSISMYLPISYYDHFSQKIFSKVFTLVKKYIEN